MGIKIYRYIAILLFIILFLISNKNIYSQSTDNFPPPEKAPIINAIKSNNKIVIDGKLLEIDWKEAETITNFFRVEPRQGGRVKYPSFVKVLFDDNNLYFGVFAKDSLGKKGIRVQDYRRDFSAGENDSFGIQLDPQNLKQYAVSFQTTPFGNQRDLQNFNDRNTDNDWNALWKVRTTRTDSGYYAEFAIPFKSLRYNLFDGKNEDPSWGITFARLARREYEQTVFPAIPQSFSAYRMTYAAQLKGLELPKPGTNIRIEPYTLYQYDRVDRGTESILDQKPKLGGDIKWAINPQSVLDITFNTDFAQVDVDRAVNNLERFNIFFPERRQFFLENSGIWANASSRSVVPFFSRRIGLEGNFNASPARINAGARYTNRTEKEAIAGLYIHQAESPNSQASSFAVGRYLKNYGNENNIGVMITHRLDQTSADLGLAQNQNATVTIDGLIRPKNELTVSYMLSASRDNTNDTLGVAGTFFTGYSSNDFYLGWLTNMVSQNYNPDMGFVFQNNVLQHNPGGYFIWRPENIPWIRRFDPGAFFNYYHDVTNPQNFQQASIYLFPIYLIFTNGSFLQYAIFPTWQNINFAFAPLGIAIEQEQYYYTRQQINFNTDQSTKLAVSGSVNWGDFYNGKRTTVLAGIRYAPSVNSAFTADYEHNNLTNLGISDRYLSTNLYTVGTRLAINPQVQFSSFYQYNSFDQQGRWNFRFSWEYQPLSFLYIVFNNARNDNFDIPFQEQQFISKITFTKQF